VTDDYLAGKYDVVDLIYPRFVSTLSQRPDHDRLLPVEPSEEEHGIPGRQVIFEPNPGAVLTQLLPRYVATRISQAVLETTASEQSARMVAMRNATDNANSLSEELTLVMNKLRQDSITNELLDLVGGQVALEG
jgi:F-type H+-transporting ATPase subunit gamma